VAFPPNPALVIRGAITIAALVAAFIGLARAGAVHGEMCVSQIGCVRAAKHDAAFERGPAVKVVTRVRTTAGLATVTTPPG
jgi:hypothetical protein